MKKEAIPTFVLFCIFLVLKLTGHIDWSWWWVTAPLWGVVPVAIAIGCLQWYWHKKAIAEVMTRFK